MNTSTMKSYGDYRHTRDSFPPPNRLRSLAVHNRRRNAQTLSAEELFGTGFVVVGNFLNERFFSRATRRRVVQLRADLVADFFRHQSVRRELAADAVTL